MHPTFKLKAQIQSKKGRSKDKFLLGCASKCDDWVQCERCNHSFHFDCVGMNNTGSSEEDEWVCKFCVH